MQLQLRDFTSLVTGMATAAQAASVTLLNTTIGSVTRALIEAVASMGVWFQWLILQVLTQTRLATSVGADADSWVNDFGMTRLPAVSSVGQLTFSRASAVSAAVVPIGAIAKTTGGTSSFYVTLDTTQTSYSAAAGGYVIPAGTAALTVPAAASLAGSAGNIQAGAVSLLATSIAGVDYVTNANPFSGGLDAESDAAMKIRFPLFINSRITGCAAAILYAATSYQQGVTAQLSENNPTAGYMVVTVDDGSGNPPTALLNGILVAINAVRPVGSIVSVVGPGVVNASINIVLALATGSNRAVVVAEINAAVAAYVGALPVGTSLSFGKLASIVYGTDPLVIAGTSILLNGGTTDLAASSTQVVRISALSVA